MGFNKAKKAGLFKLIKNTRAGNAPLTPGLGIICPNAGQASAAPTTRFKRRRVNENGNGVLRLVQPMSGYRADKQQTRPKFVLNLIGSQTDDFNGQLHQKNIKINF